MQHEPLRHYVSDHGLVAGCDEAGRGCLAGPVFAAAVILPDHPSAGLSSRLNDSKKLRPAHRSQLRHMIEEQAVAFGVAMVGNEEIDRINILQASIRAMHLALDQLMPRPGMVLVDGNRFLPYQNLPHRCMVRGDATWLSIAAASVLAKTWRDEHMEDQHKTFPSYEWKKNKGYPTAAHREAIAKYGPSPIHRKTFRLLYG